MDDLELMGTLLAFFAATVWGISAVMYKYVVKTDVTAFLTIIIRGLFGVPFIAIIAFLLVKFKSLPILLSPEVFPLVFMSSCFVATAEMWLFGAMKRLDVSKAQPIASIYPLFSSILLFMFDIEPFSLMVIVGTILIISGIALVAQQTNQSTNSSTNISSEDSQNITLGIIMALLAAIFWGFAIFTLRLILENPDVDTFSLATLRFGLMITIIAIIWFSLGIKNSEHFNEIKAFNTRNILILGTGGILAMGLGALSFFQSIELIGASKATPISSINPLIAAILGVMFLKEKISIIQTIGILLTVSLQLKKY